jgi:predicted Zn-dependent peptidase
MPNTRAVSIGFFIGAGSRYEKDEQAGISHFIEHICFKGTQRRATGREISEIIEGVGGILNGGTDKELTVYWCKVAQPHFLQSLDVLADMLCNSRFDQQDIEKERQIISEEIDMCMDLPPTRVGLLIDEVMWPNQAIGRDVAGTKDTVSSITRADMMTYITNQYTASNVVVSIAGGITHEDAIESLNNNYTCLQDGTPQNLHPVQEEQAEPRLRIEQKETEQAHLCLALRGLSLTHPDRFVIDLLSVILGEGMSSRLFTEVRENLGLAYSIHSTTDHLLDTGSLSIYAGVEPKNLSTAIEAILNELKRLKKEIPERELSKARELAKGRLLLRMEDTRSVVSWHGIQELLLGKVLSVDEVVSMIDSIQLEDLMRVAEKHIVNEGLNLAVVGPANDAHHINELLHL